MNTTPEVALRVSLQRLIQGEITLGDFEVWFDPVLWSVESSESPTAVRLAYEIAGQLAEYEQGHWTPSDLFNQLADLIDSNEVNPTALGKLVLCRLSFGAILGLVMFSSAVLPSGSPIRPLRRVRRHR